MHSQAWQLLGINALRKNKIVHRDLKPANLLIAPDGHLVIADLGLARSFGLHDADIAQAASKYDVDFTPQKLSEAEKTFRVVTRRGCGTAEYMAPEVWRGEEYAYSVDMWAFGVIMYELLLGKVSRGNHTVLDQVLTTHMLQLPWDMYKSGYGDLKGPELFGSIVLNEEVVVTDEDRVHFNVDAQAEQFILAVGLLLFCYWLASTEDGWIGSCQG